MGHARFSLKDPTNFRTNSLSCAKSSPVRPLELVPLLVVLHPLLQSLNPLQTVQLDFMCSAFFRSAILIQGHPSLLAISCGHDLWISHASLWACHKLVYLPFLPAPWSCSRAKLMIHKCCVSLHASSWLPYTMFPSSADFYFQLQLAHDMPLADGKQAAGIEDGITGGQED